MNHPNRRKPVLKLPKPELIAQKLLKLELRKLRPEPREDGVQQAEERAPLRRRRQKKHQRAIQKIRARRKVLRQNLNPHQEEDGLHAKPPRHALSLKRPRPLRQSPRVVLD